MKNLSKIDLNKLNVKKLNKIIDIINDELNSNNIKNKDELLLYKEKLTDAKYILDEISFNKYNPNLLDIMY